MFTHPTQPKARGAHISLDGDMLVRRLQSSGRPVRTWTDTAGNIVGIWRARNGSTIAFGHWYATAGLVAFRANAPRDDWAGDYI